LERFKDFRPDGKGVNPTNLRVCTLLIAYYYFVQEKYDNCMGKVRDAIKINSICNLASYMYSQILRKTRPEIWERTGKWTCSTPFDQAWVINEGEVYTCCPVYLQIPIGNVYEQEWDDIWNSKVAQEIRSSILDGSFKYCNWFVCPVIVDHFLGGKVLGAIEQSLDNVGRYKTIIDRNQPLRLAGAANDYTCNLYCPSCRRERFKPSDDHKKKLEFAKEKVILPLLKNTIKFSLSGGEPFASRYSKEMLSLINKTDFPFLERLEITTNGLLLDEKQWEELKNIHYLKIDLLVSVDATKEETYRIVRRGGNFGRLMENLQFISKLRKEMRINCFSINFVVQDHNYHEMPDFVALGLQLGVDFIAFQKIYNAGTFSPEEFSQRTVFEPTHPDFDKFIDILRMPVFSEHAHILKFVGFEQFVFAAKAQSA